MRGKCWRIIKDWYTNLSSQVRLGNQLSSSFSVERGIRQGSVLSPYLFNAVIDALLQDLKSRDLGLSINSLFLGAFAHADDIRTALTNPTDLFHQSQIVNSYVDRRCLKLCQDKCGIVISGNQSVSRLLSTDIPVEDAVKCLGVWWCSNFSSRESIEERINKARGAFFAHGQLGAFHGLLNQLSSRSLIESCVIPVLMYGTESWYLNETLLSKLESFQAQLGKRVLKITKFNNMALHWPSMRCRCLCAKLSFLYRICCGGEGSLWDQVFT